MNKCTQGSKQVLELPLRSSYTRNEHIRFCISPYRYHGSKTHERAYLSIEVEAPQKDGFGVKAYGQLSVNIMGQVTSHEKELDRRKKMQDAL